MISPLRQHAISTDYGVITMRQDVRQLARELGLGLSQQAKIATAISAIARALITMHGNAVVQVWVDHQAPNPALEVTCRVLASHQAEDLAHIKQAIRFDETRILVDEATLSSDADGMLIGLRMHLRR